MVDQLNIKRLLIVAYASGVFNLSLVILWLAYIWIIRKTSLYALKIIAAMMIAYNLAWFLCFLGIYECAYIKGP